MADVMGTEGELALDSPGSYVLAWQLHDVPPISFSIFGE